MLFFIDEALEKRVIGYYSTDKEYKAGDIVTIERNIENHKHWPLRKKILEKCFELVRSGMFPKKNSRLKCIFVNPTKKNRFSRIASKTYVVEILGERNYVDSMLVDDLMDNISDTVDLDKARELAVDNLDIIRAYWEGKINNRSDVEILCERVKIIEKADYDISKGDIIQLKKEQEVIYYTATNEYKKYKYTDYDDLGTDIFKKVKLPRGTKIHIDYLPKRNGKKYHLSGYIIGNKNRDIISFDIDLNDVIVEKS